MTQQDPALASCLLAGLYWNSSCQLGVHRGCWLLLLCSHAHLESQRAWGVLREASSALQPVKVVNRSAVTPN